MISTTLPIFASFVDGKMAEGSEQSFDLVTPQNSRIAGRISESGTLGVNKAVNAAAAAFTANRKQPTHQRIAWLKSAAAALMAASGEVAATICEDVAKPIRPPTGDHVLLADACLILELNLYCPDVDRLFARDLVQARGEVF